MEKSRVAIVIDSLALGVLVFFLTLAWLGRHIARRQLLLSISAALAAAAFILAYVLSRRAQRSKKLSRDELNKMELIRKALLYQSQAGEVQFFERLLNAKYLGGKLYHAKNIDYYVEARQPLTAADFIAANQHHIEHKHTSLCFICWQQDEKFTALSEGYSEKFKTFTSAELFKFMQEQNCFPKNLNEFQSHTPRQKFFSKYAQNIGRAHFKDFFFSGLALLAISIVIPYHTYYFVFGTALALLSVLCLFAKKNKIEPKNNESLSSYIKSKDKN